MAAPTAVLIDTDVYSGLFTHPGLAARRGQPINDWQAVLGGRRLVISFQTRAEVLAGLQSSGWGPTRTEQAKAKLDSTPTIYVDPEVIDAFASLQAACKRAGHPLHQKIHTGDRWVAASALAKDLPLLSNDSIFQGAPGLTLF